MGSIVARKTRSGETKYVAYVRRKNHPSRTQTFSTRTKARSWIKRIEAAIEEHRDLPHREALRTTFAELVDTYVESEGYTRLSKGEQRKRAAQLAAWVEVLGEKKLAEITSATIESAGAKLKARGGRGRAITSATLNRYSAALSACCSYAVKRDLLPTNPASSKKVTRGRENRRDRVLTADERERLLTACLEQDVALHLLALRALTTGGRQGELLRLRWKQVDLTANEERVSFLKTKNSNPRSVPLPRVAIEALRSTPRRIDGALFASEQFPLQQWRRALRLAKLENLRFHDLRHVYATTLAENGASLAELQAALGHLTPSMVSRYSHMTERAVEDTLRRRMVERGITFV